MRLLKWMPILMIAAFAAGCDDSTSMCSTANDCANFCRTYENNSVMYACSSGSCVCLDESKLACTGDQEKDKCVQICALYAPNSTPVCDSGSCKCQESDSTPSAQ